MNCNESALYHSLIPKCMVWCRSPIHAYAHVCHRPGPADFLACWIQISCCGLPNVGILPQYYTAS